MIADRISNAEQYFGMGARIKTALQYLINTDFSQLIPEKYIIDGDDIFALVQDYETTSPEKCLLEAHKKFIDVQFMVKGEECIGYEPLGDQEIAESYHEKEDYWLFRGNPVLIRYAEGMFGIFYPQDLHMPRVISGRRMPVRKVVVKVKVD